jgi:outer membrane protein
VTGEEARYSFVLVADGTFNIGNTPTLTLGMGGVGNVQMLYNEQVVLGTTLRRQFEWGTLVELRAQGGRQLRRGVFVPGVPAISVGPGYAFDSSLTVTQPLLRGFGDRTGLATLRQARVDRDRTRASRLRQASELVRDTEVAYWEAWYGAAALDVQRSARDLAQAQANEAQERERLGALAHPDALAFQTRLAAAEEAVAAAEATLAMRQQDLGRLLGSEQTLGDIDSAPPPMPPARSQDAVERALRASPQIAELEAQVYSARELAQTAGATLEPRLDLQGQLAVHGLGYDDVGGTFQTFGTFAAVTGMLSVIFELPLDDTQRNMEYERASLAIQVAERQLDAARLQIASTARTLVVQAEAARHRVELAENTQNVARELVEAERARFALGASTAIAVTQAENELRDAQLRGLRARVDLYSADQQLAHLTGQLVTSE